MSLIAGTTVRLHVEREVSPYGFFLNAGDQDVMLHYTELTEKVKQAIKLKFSFSLIPRTVLRQR